MQTTKPAQRGFSLIEMTVVLLIIGILIYMTLSAGIQQLEIARIKQTQYKLQKIQTALTIYYKTYGHLPCPADGAAPKTSSAFGVQGGYTNPSTANGDARCSAVNLVDPVPITLYVGVIPVRDLGMADDAMIDGWGNRLTYIVSVSCIDPDDWSLTNKYKCGYAQQNPNPAIPAVFDPTRDGGRIRPLGKNTQPWADYAAYMVISHGSSGMGSWPGAGGPKVNMGLGVASSAEYNNGNMDPGTGNELTSTQANRLYYDLPINDGDVPGNYYDNLTNWNTSAQIYFNANH